MCKNTELFEFLSELIDIQIKKYVKLATRGVGPDARLNASLVYDEVNELLGMQKTLLTLIEGGDNLGIFMSVFEQIKFYVEQEWLRGYAGWLLDDNNIHDTVDKRTKKQLEQLENIANLANIEFTQKSDPVSEIQKQCQHDSNEIAYRILDLARNIRADSTMQINDKIPKHAQSILRKNATTRYMEFALYIDNLYEECENFLKNSPLEKRCSLLTKQMARENELSHFMQWHELLRHYQQLHPNSRLFSEDHKWEEVGSLAETTVFTKQNLRFLGGLFLTGGMLVHWLLPYFMQQDSNSMQNTSSLCS